jgi:Family of unknown function (DUF6152)
MKRDAVRSVALATVLLMLCGPMFAHHGTNSEYDAKHPITLMGTVTEFEFVNPHVQIYFDAKDDKGNVVHWGCEAPSPGRLVRIGWTRHELKPGDQITITLDPARSGAAVGALRKLVTPEGKEMGVTPIVPDSEK